jgi:fructuronate reductase
MALLSRAALDPLPSDGAGTGIVHIGVGAFHRAHQAVYTEDAMAAAGGDWGIAAIAPRSADVVAALAAQDRLFSVTSVSARGTHTRVIGAFTEVRRALDDPGAVLARIADPAVRVITLTVTEKAYRLDPVDGRLMMADDLAADLGTDRPPTTVPGLLVRGLTERCRAGAGPIAVVSCDNLPSNGRRTRDMVHQAMHRLPDTHRREVHEWIGANVTFPGTMVDRIVPAPTPATLATAERELGLRDLAAVHAEPYSQWVIEDDFPGGRPAWERAGAVLTDDAKPWERLKLRALNGVHSGIAYLGALAGCPTVSAALEMPGMRAVMNRFLADDVAGSLTPPDGITVGAYGRSVLERFADPGIAHRTIQVAKDGSQKLPQRLLGTIRDRLAADAPFRRLALGVAAWMRYVSGVDEGGRPIDVRDPMSARLRALADEAGPVADRLAPALLGIGEIFGDLARDPRFAAPVTEALRRLLAEGAKRTVAGLG